MNCFSVICWFKWWFVFIWWRFSCWRFICWRVTIRHFQFIFPTQIIQKTIFFSRITWHVHIDVGDEFWSLCWWQIEDIADRFIRDYRASTSSKSYQHTYSEIVTIIKSSTSYGPMKILGSFIIQKSKIIFLINLEH